MNFPRWFLDRGIKVFPIKHRDKVPACASWDDHEATIEEIKSWTNYGVNLGSGFLGVLDTDEPEIERWAAAHAPPTPFTVKTARGLHRYYRLTGAAPHFIHRAGHTIEFRNQGQYVVGPGSVHSTGHVYTASSWSWRITDLPFFPVNDFCWEDRPEGERGSADGQPLVLPPVIKAGERHDLLFKMMRSLQARGVEDVEQLLTILRAENRAKCVPPIDDRELTRYVRRVARYKDRADFIRMDTVEATELAGAMIEQGASVDAAVAAAKAVDPEFDPGGSSPAPNEDKLKREVERLEKQIAKAKADAEAQPAGTLEADLEVIDLDEDNLEIIDVEEIE